MRWHPAWQGSTTAPLLRYPRAVELLRSARRHRVRRRRIAGHVLEVRRRQARALLQRADEGDDRIPVHQGYAHTGSRQGVPRSEPRAAWAGTRRGGAVVDQHTVRTGDAEELAVG